MKLKFFYYNLPGKYIAQKPLQNRDNSKLLVLDKKTGKINHDIFFNIDKYLESEDILVINESRVEKCRLIGRKEDTGAKIECFVIKKIWGKKYLVLLRPSKRLKVGSKVIVGKYYFIVESKQDYGKAIVKFSNAAKEIFTSCGKMPIPPYIKKASIDPDRYQTIYARKKGSVAAPTAGLHFTLNLIKKIRKRNIKFAKVRLDIGLDTFKPITESEIEQHKIHSEYYYISKKEAEKINRAKSNGGRVIAVGTTTTRVLETVMTKYGYLKNDSGNTNLYIYPGYKFKLIDCMITNFHLPYSTLLVMVSAFAGRKNIINSYNEAKLKNYRFYSFGDCMFIK